uniref:Uncharacterized protein n=1 Tax=Arion vulgaris TaxID=1028688 RepID=A0A0B7AIL6_9EUPU
MAECQLCHTHVIVGSLWVEHYGVMEITNNSNNISAVLNFKQSGWLPRTCTMWKVLYTETK